MEREGKTQREGGIQEEGDLLFAESLPKQPECLGLDQAKARSPEYNLGLPQVWQGSNSQAPFCCFKRHFSKDLNHKHSGQGLTQ